MRRFIATTLVLAAGGCLAAPTAQAQGFDTVSRGDRGPEVRIVQKALKGLGYRMAVDGVFGRQTTSTVRRYERRQRIRIDGKVSRGQARGMLKRARMSTKVLATVDDASKAKAAPRAVPGPSTPNFPIQGAWTKGDGFGERAGGHDGVDLLADCGTPLVAAESGRVVFTGTQSRAGHYVVVRSAASGEDHVYMHLDGAAETAKGDTVQAGQRLGAVGRTGNASTCHLHFEIWTAPGWYEGGAARDPAPDIARWGGGSAPTA